MWREGSNELNKLLLRQLSVWLIVVQCLSPHATLHSWSIEPASLLILPALAPVRHRRRWTQAEGLGREARKHKQFVRTRGYLTRKEQRQRERQRRTWKDYVSKSELMLERKSIAEISIEAEEAEIQRLEAEINSLRAAKGAKETSADEGDASHQINVT